MAPNIDLSELTAKLNKLQSTLQNSGDVFDNTFKDMVSRAPGKIASAVTSEFSIKKSEITHKSKFKKSAGNISIHGQTLSSLEIRYAGRLLTPLHFSMRPKSRPNTKKYKVKAKIKKQLKTFQAKEGGGVFLAPAAKSATVLPWMRFSSDSFDIAPIKTLSLPQMVDNDQVREKINKDLSELVDTRYQHHLDRHISRGLK